MLSALIAGALFSVGHHLFYASLDQSSASDLLEYDVLGMTVSQQQFNTGLGTAFAFLVRACLMISISVAYFQILIWNVTRRRSGATKVRELDTMTSALLDLISAADLRVWMRRPYMLILVIIAWYATSNPRNNQPLTSEQVGTCREHHHARNAIHWHPCPSV